MEEKQYILKYKHTKKQYKIAFMQLFFKPSVSLFSGYKRVQIITVLNWFINIFYESAKTWCLLGSFPPWVKIAISEFLQNYGIQRQNQATSVKKIWFLRVFISLCKWKRNLFLKIKADLWSCMVYISEQVMFAVYQRIVCVCNIKWWGGFAMLYPFVSERWGINL